MGRFFLKLFIDSMMDYEELIVMPQFLKLFETVKTWTQTCFNKFDEESAKWF